MPEMSKIHACLVDARDFVNNAIKTNQLDLLSLYPEKIILAYVAIAAGV